MKHVVNATLVKRYHFDHVARDAIDYMQISVSHCALLLSCYVILLWPPYGIGQAVIFLPYGFFHSFFFSSPNLSGPRLDVSHGVALVRI